VKKDVRRFFMKILFVVFGVTALLALRALAMPLHYPSIDDFADDEMPIDELPVLMQTVDMPEPDEE